MDDREHHRSMSLIPYAPAESREIVLYVILTSTAILQYREV